MFRNLIVSGFCVAFVLAADIALPGNCTNTPQSRNCWGNGFDITTNYYNASLVPPGKVVEYEFTVSQETIAPDGYEWLGMVVNGQYPGPTIEADWGDTLRITVHNNFTANHNGTAIHWHGVSQFQTNWQDGVPAVTQCPSKPGEAQVYEFRALQYGTSWYHSHFSLQYSNGLYGPLVIHGPSSANYDVDLGPWLLSDWFHADFFSLYQVGLVSGLSAIPETSVLNGKGIFDCERGNYTACTGQAEYFEVTFVEGTKYKIGIVNTGTLLTYTFWIAGHNFTVVETDFVPIEPFTTAALNVGIGQRYEVVVEADADFEHGSNFWIFAQYCPEPDIIPKKVGIVRYKENDTSEPHTPSLSEQFPEFGCADPDPKSLVPIVKQKVGNRVNDLEPEDYLTMGEQSWPNASDPLALVHKWIIKDTPMFLDWQDPSLKKLTLDSKPDFPVETVPIFLDFDTGEWVYFIIVSNYSLADVSIPRNLTPTVHPIHLHGHDFAILAQGPGEFPSDTIPNLDNPARRDVVDVDIGGWAWIAFQIGNPGAWLLHCHIAGHVSPGLALQFIEQPSKIKGLMEDAGVLDEFSDRCDAWSRFYEDVSIPANATQAPTDSGI